MHAEEEPAVPAVRMYLTVVCLLAQRLYDQYWSMAVQHWAGSQDEVWHQPLAAGKDQAAVEAVQAVQVPNTECPLECAIDPHSPASTENTRGRSTRASNRPSKISQGGLCMGLSLIHI